MKDVEIKLVKTLKSKKIFNIFFQGKDSKFVGQEIFSNGEIKRYPFYEKEGKIVPKYKSIKCLTTINKTKPNSGFSTSESKGFGFTNPKGVANLFYYFQDKLPKVDEVIFIEEGETQIVNNKLSITFTDFYTLEKQTETFVKLKKQEAENLYQDTLSKVLPKEFKPVKKKQYIPGTFSSYLNSFVNITLSKDDRDNLKDLFINSDLPIDTVISARNELDIIYIEDVISEYKILMQQSTFTKALEEKWHKFFKKHTWIFSHIFSFPAVFLRDKFNVGGHNIEGNTDKIVDFIYKNSISNNIAFIEIKTHLTSLISNTEYRKPDIFSVSSDLSGSIIQVLDQKDKLLKNFNSKVGGVADSLNSICVVIAGRTDDFRKNGQKGSFELFRWSNKDVIIIPYDELLNKIENILSIFKKKI
jgi:hypothetical protein